MTQCNSRDFFVTHASRIKRTTSYRPAIDRPSKTTAIQNKQPPEQQQEQNKKNQTNTEPAIDRPSKQQQYKKKQTNNQLYVDIQKNSTKRTNNRLLPHQP